jgi:hypothetical protein
VTDHVDARYKHEDCQQNNLYENQFYFSKVFIEINITYN